MEQKINLGCVYFFKHVGLTPIKIGFTLHPSPIVRFLQFKTYAPFGAEILGFIKSSEPNELERMLHEKFSSYRIKGEWFEIPEELALKTIDFYSNLSDIEERNKFQIEWAKKNKKSQDQEIHDKISSAILRLFEISEEKNSCVYNLSEIIYILENNGIISNDNITKKKLSTILDTIGLKSKKYRILDRVKDGYRLKLIGS